MSCAAAAPTTEPSATVSVAVRDLLRHPLVRREEGSGTRAAAEHALRALMGDADGEGSEALPVACEMGSTEAQCAALRAGRLPQRLGQRIVEGELSFHNGVDFSCFCHSVNGHREENERNPGVVGRRCTHGSLGKMAARNGVTRRLRASPGQGSG